MGKSTINHHVQQLCYKLPEGTTCLKNDVVPLLGLITGGPYCDKEDAGSFCHHPSHFAASKPSMTPWYKLHINIYIYIHIQLLIGGLEHFLFSHSVGNVIIPTDEIIFFQRGRYTTNQIQCMLFHHSSPRLVTQS